MSQRAGFSPRAVFQSFRPSQDIIQKRPEIGLDDLEFTPRYRDLLRKVIDNAWAGPPGRATTNAPRQFGSPTTLSVGTIGQARSALNLSLPGLAGPTRPAARIGPGDPGSRRRTGFPPHGTVQASVTLARAHRLTRAIDAVYKADGSHSRGISENWSSLVIKRLVGVRIGRPARARQNRGSAHARDGNSPFPAEDRNS